MQHELSIAIIGFFVWFVIVSGLEILVGSGIAIAVGVALAALSFWRGQPQDPEGCVFASEPDAASGGSGGDGGCGD